ncbi:MAG: hypothetical protein JO002_06985 [Burkholderiaceae bacterium]|nr:hypothetical protein [Burkholderiaceae bacterium]
MTTIIAARLQLQDQIDEATEALCKAGFARSGIASFYVNPPGQHAVFPIGGDRFESPGAKESGEGAAKGAAAAAAAGVALGAGLSPAGAVIGGLVGAHAGSLLGTLSHAKEKGETEKSGTEDAAAGQSESGDDSNAQPLRRAGMLIAVAIADKAREGDALRVLKRCGAAEVEKTEGNIEQGEWLDFDPLSTPNYLPGNS